MAGKRTNRLRVRIFPWRTGLMTAGRQTTIDETALWQAKNVTAELDGLLAKRPGLLQWGQTLKVPDSSATGSTITQFADFLNGLAGFTETDSGVPSGSEITLSTHEGALTTNVRLDAADGKKTITLSRAVASLSLGDVWSLRITLKGSNLSEYDGLETDPRTFVFRAQAANGTGREFALYDDGLYYKKASDNTYGLIAGTVNLALGGWNTLEIQCSDAGNTLVYVNDVLAATLTSSDLVAAALTGTDSYEFQWMNHATGQYSTHVSTVMYNDSVTDPFEAVSIAGIKSFQYKTISGSKQRALLCAAGDYIYHDNGLFGSWRPLHPRKNQHVYFTGYRRTIVWSDNNAGKVAALWQWNGFDDPELLDDAPPLVFMVEHQQRLFGATANSLRIYYSADREPNNWHSTDNEEFDTIINAGWIEIPGKEGDEVTAIYGDFYGLAVAFTRTGVWRIDGHGPTSYSRNTINQDVGCETPNAVSQVGNDLWFVSRQGVHSLAATDKFGNIAMQNPSAPIQNLWTQSPSSVLTISREYLGNASLRYNPHQGLVYVALPLTGDKAAQNVYVYNVGVKQWYGPWTIDSRAMENVEVATPVIEVMMHGNEDGQVGYTDPTFKADYGTGSVDMLLETAYINGRSIDPNLPAMVKTFKTIRLLVLPRGDWEFTVTYRVDAKLEADVETRTQNTFPDDTFFLGADAATDNGDFRLSISPDAVLRSREEMGVIEIPLDERGLGLACIIEQTGAGKDLVVQGIEIDFLADGYEVSTDGDS